jgi:hypothetical protein
MNPFTLLTLFLIACLAAAVTPYIIGRRALARKRTRARPSGYDPGLALMAHPSADRDGPIFEFVDDHALNPTMPDADR